MGNTDSVRNDIHGVSRQGKKTTNNSIQQAVAQSKGNPGTGATMGHAPGNHGFSDQKHLENNDAGFKDHGVDGDHLVTKGANYNYGLKNEVDSINMQRNGGEDVTKPAPYMKEQGLHQDYGVDNVRTNGTEYVHGGVFNYGLKNEVDAINLFNAHGVEVNKQSHNMPVNEHPDVVKANEEAIKAAEGKKHDHNKDEKKSESKNENHKQDDDKCEKPDCERKGAEKLSCHRGDCEHKLDLDKLPLVTLHEKSEPMVDFVAPAVLIVSLEEDPSKQMKWVISPNSSNMFKLHDESKKDESATSQIRVFRILVANGEDDLSFDYINPWKGVLPEKTVKFSIKAHS